MSRRPTTSSPSDRVDGGGRDTAIGRISKHIGALDATAWALIAAGVALLVYFPSLLNGFAYDDLPLIVDNPQLRSWAGLWDLLHTPYWPTDGAETGLWRPATTGALLILFNIGGGAALPFHVANVALHCVVTWLVVRITASMFPVQVAALAGVIFAVHPVHVEAVANGIGIAELLAAFFTLAALDVVLHARRPGPGRLGPGRIAAVSALFLLGFWSKESAVVLPALILLCDAARLRLEARHLTRWIFDRAVLMGALAAVVVGTLLWRSRILDLAVGAPPPLGASQLSEIPRIWTLGEVWFHLLRVLTVPSWLSPDYSPDVIPVVARWTDRGVLGVFGALSVLGLAWWAARRPNGSLAPIEGPRRAAAPAVAFGVAWFVVAYSPVSNVLFLTGVVFAERVLYLPSVGISVGIAGLLVGLVSLARQRMTLRRATVAACGTLLAVWGGTTVTYIPAWKSQEHLLRHVVEWIPQSGRTAWLLGSLAVTRGDMDSAREHYRIARRRLGNDHAFLMKSSRLLRANGQLALARAHLSGAYVARPGEPGIPEALAALSLQLGDEERAERWAHLGTVNQPDAAAPWLLLAQSLAGQERWADAARAAEEVARREESRAEPWMIVARYRENAGDVSGASDAVDSARARLPPGSSSLALDSLVSRLQSHR